LGTNMYQTCPCRVRCGCRHSRRHRHCPSITSRAATLAIVALAAARLAQQAWVGLRWFPRRPCTPYVVAALVDLVVLLFYVCLSCFPHFDATCLCCPCSHNLWIPILLCFCVYMWRLVACNWWSGTLFLPRRCLTTGLPSRPRGNDDVRVCQKTEEPQVKTRHRAQSFLASITN